MSSLDRFFNANLSPDAEGSGGDSGAGDASSNPEGSAGESPQQPAPESKPESKPAAKKSSNVSSSAEAALAAAKAAISSIQNEAQSAGQKPVDPTQPVAGQAPTPAEAEIGGQTPLTDEGEGDAVAAATTAAPTSSGPQTDQFEMPKFSDSHLSGKAAAIDLLSNVNLNVRIELGRTRMLVEDVLRLNEGSVVELDKLAGDPVDVYVNDRRVASGEVLVLNDNFCVRINEIFSRTLGRRREA